MKLHALALGTLALVSAAGAHAGEFLQPVKAQELTAARLTSESIVSRLQKQPGTRGVQLVKLNFPALAGDTVELSVAPGVTVKLHRSGLQRRGYADYTWYGEGADDEATLAVLGGEVTGTVRHKGRQFQIRPVRDGLHAVTEMNFDTLPPEEPESFNERSRKRSLQRQPELSSKPFADTAGIGVLANPVINVLVAYTGKAQTGSGNIDTLIQNAIDRTNNSYGNSGVNLSVNLVHKVKVNYDETGRSYDMVLSQFTNQGDGLMDEIHTLRKQYDADVAVLMFDNSAYCGVARTIRAQSLSSFALVHYSCADGNLSFAHEIGHLQGARHNPEADDTTWPFAYGHGFRFGSGATGWRTVMSYNCSPGCVRLPNWSNPNVQRDGVAMGTAATHHNARVLNETAASLASFQPSSGAIWRHTGVPCSGNSCPGWQILDNNGKSAAIAAGGSGLYQLHTDGAIWRYTGTPCSGSSCPGWTRLDNNPATKAIAAGDAGRLYQLHNDGRIWRSTGAPCSGNSCPGWTMLDNNPKTIAIAAAGTQLYQLHNDGAIWRSTGAACSGNSCPGWTRLDANPNASAIVAAGSELYQLHKDGKIWRFTGTACNASGCPGWQLLDSNSKTVSLVAAGSALYQLHNDGMIWRYTGVPCTSSGCPGWQKLDNNGKTIALAAAGSALYQLHDDGWVWRYTGTPCSGNSCPGWQRLDNNPRTHAIVAGGTQLYQLH